MEGYPLDVRIRSACDAFEEAENFADVVPLLDTDVLEELRRLVEAELVERREGE
jgi:hypothetical protein